LFKFNYIQKTVKLFLPPLPVDYSIFQTFTLLSALQNSWLDLNTRGEGNRRDPHTFMCVPCDNYMDTQL